MEAVFTVAGKQRRGEVYKENKKTIWVTVLGTTKFTNTIFLVPDKTIKRHKVKHQVKIL